MTLTTNVPGLTLTDRGWVVPSEQLVLTGVQTDIDQAFGGGVNPALNTPQGQIATSNTAIIGQVNDSVALQFNMVDPAYAAGRMQDAIGRIYFITRKPALPTVVQAVCNGSAGVPIPIGSLARASDGNTYACTDGGVIGPGGNVTLAFACTVDGPIACPANGLTIFRAIPGWDSVNNPADGVLGNVVESRAEFERRRAASVALNARGSLSSVQGAVLNVTDVLDAYVTENTTGAPIVIRGVTVAAKSIYVSAVGGTDQAVANAIWSKKAPGCGYNGNTTINVVDSNSAYSPPLPTYAVSFERPTSLAILYTVLIQNSLQVPSDAIAQVQAAIIAAFAGADGGTRARIGSTIYSSRYYAPIAALGTWAQLISVLVGSNNAPSAQVTASIAGNIMTVSAVASGGIAIGQTISDAAGGIIVGTKVLSGAHPTWTLSNSQVISSRAMTAAAPTQTLTAVNADQAPTINAGNIVVAFT